MTKAVFDHAEAIGPNVHTFWFKPEARVRFEPGQFAEFTIPHANPDDRGITREFSIASLPGEPLVALTTNFARTNGSSFKRALRKLRPGDVITMAEPMGDFVLPKDASIPLVFIAAGVGSVPYAAMVRWLRRRGEQRSIKLIYSASQPENFIYDKLWRDYNLAFIPILTRPHASWRGQTGRLTPKKILELASPITNQLLYLAGPQSMIEPLFDDLLRAGIPRGQLLLDYFSGY